MPVCKDCGRSTERKVCPYCGREKRWEENKIRRSITNNPNIFTPRISSDLNKIMPLHCSKSEEICSWMEVKDGIAKKGLYICGPVGCGKTILAACAATELARQLYIENLVYDNIEFVSVPVLLHRIRATIQGKTGETETELVDRYSEADVLVLDDLGAEKDSEWALQTLYIILNNRYENELPTIITSNLSLDDLASKLSNDRIPSRIAATCKVIEMDGEDRRLV